MEPFSRFGGSSENGSFSTDLEKSIGTYEPSVSNSFGFSAAALTTTLLSGPILKPFPRHLKFMHIGLRTADILCNVQIEAMIYMQ